MMRKLIGDFLAVAGVSVRAASIDVVLNNSRALLTKIWNERSEEKEKKWSPLILILAYNGLSTC